ncbi:membrane-associated progesterone receptor component 1-like [Neocloeon triangulifer]|uniref:membrane-associated progesterone receptor component 1-like n=1 Tax=Neocloeon triangulifer TaxID=2078957 RepID=UPI00286EEE3B|nr:membrane-associated progesterone receptor component 1-like [Neocloeon triangulifer]
MAEKVPEAEAAPAGGGSVLVEVLLQIVSSPLNIALVGLILVLLYKIWKSRQPSAAAAAHVSEPELPKLRKDFTVEDLRAFAGDSGDGRILIAVNGKVFDVTRGRRFYGPGGPYAAFGGRDASRGLATFQVGPGKDEYDDLSDLTPAEMESVREWEMQFTEKYTYVGRLLKPGEKPTDYSEEEEDQVEKPKDE